MSHDASMRAKAKYSASGIYASIDRMLMRKHIEKQKK